MRLDLHPISGVLETLKEQPRGLSLFRTCAHLGVRDCFIDYENRRLRGDIRMLNTHLCRQVLNEPPEMFLLLSGDYEGLADEVSALAENIGRREAKALRMLKLLLQDVSNDFQAAAR